MNKSKGFTILEIIISVAIFATILLALFSFLSSMTASNSKTSIDAEVFANAKRALEEMAFEIRSANSVYTPTTTASQLSLETPRYLSNGQTSTYIDFFMCDTPNGYAVCFKKEYQDPVALTSDYVYVSNLEFSQISTGSSQSVKISLTVNYSGPGGSSLPVTFTSTASLRSY